MKADSKTQFWRSHRSARSESPRESMATVRQGGGVASRARSDEYVYVLLDHIVVCGYDCPSSDSNMKRNRDEAQMSKLQQLGMNSTEEAKLMAMRDYILKLARAISR